MQGRGFYTFVPAFRISVFIVNTFLVSFTHSITVTERYSSSYDIPIKTTADINVAITFIAEIPFSPTNMTGYDNVRHESENLEYYVDA